MIFPSVVKLIFITLCLVIIVVETALSVLMFKKRNEYKYWICWPVWVGIATTVAYCLFLLVGPENHRMAVFFDSLFFIGTDWLAMLMFMFAISYTGVLLRYRKTIGIICGIACIIDSLSLLINNFYYLMFDLVLRYDTLGNYYWANFFMFPHYIHLGICYVMVGLTFVFFAIVTNSSPKIYKTKYKGILIAYIVVIIANMLSYGANLPIDFSVVLYGILAGFICYYSTYSFPHKLLSLTLEAVNEIITDAVLYYDSDGSLIYANHTACSIFGDGDKIEKEKAEAFRRNWIKNHQDAENNSEDLSIERFSIDGKEFIYKVEHQVEYAETTVVGFLIRLIDKTVELTDLERERYIATHDELTGLLNRNGFFEAVDEWNEKHGTENRIMLCSNIKDFKLINELFGEKIGDMVLLREANYLKQSAHSDSIFARLADDKFGLYMAAENFSEQTMERFITGVKTITDSSMYKMHINVGIYDPQGRNESAQVMADKAFMAITAVKGDYNKIFGYYDSSLMEKLLVERNITSDFESAIEKGEIQMYLQPIIDSKNRELGAEALCRWQHPLRGLLLPAAFLPVLEKNGLIYQLDEYIWEQAAMRLGQWRKMGAHDCYISVNVSVKDFFFIDVYKTFTSLVEKYDIEPSTLHIEITESVLMSDFAKAFMLSNKLQKYGFVVAIDNFGSGYSSLNMLKDLHPSILKIDMGLHRNIEEVRRNEIILIAMIEMARSLDMEIVGEGVENREQYDALMKLDCCIFQGNILAEPIPADVYEKEFVKYFIN